MDTPGNEDMHQSEAGRIIKTGGRARKSAAMSSNGNQASTFGDGW